MKVCWSQFIQGKEKHIEYDEHGFWRRSDPSANFFAMSSAPMQIFGPGLCRSWAHCRSAAAGGNGQHATCGLRILTQKCGVKSESFEA